MEKDLLEKQYNLTTTAILKNDIKKFKEVFGVGEGFDFNYHVNPNDFKGSATNPFTPLLACAYLNIEECLLYIIDNFKDKINLSAVDINGKNFFYFLVTNGNIGLLKKVCERLGADDVLMVLNQETVGNIDTPFLELLSSLGTSDWEEATKFVKSVLPSIDINMKSKCGSTAIMIALRAGNYVLVDTLLNARGLDLLCKDKDGYNAWDVVENEVVRSNRYYPPNVVNEAEVYRLAVKAKLFSLYESQLLGGDSKGKVVGGKPFKC